MAARSVAEAWPVSTVSMTPYSISATLATKIGRAWEKMPRAIVGSMPAGAVGPLTYRVPGACLPLSPRELLEQAPHDDGFVPGLEIDGIDRDLVEVAALVRPLLDVDVRLSRGEGKL